MWNELPTTTERQLKYLERHPRAGRFFYEHLGVIDFKASCLLIVDSILLAILAIVVDKVPPGSSNRSLIILVDLAKWVGGLALLFSIALALLVVWLHWRSLDDLLKLSLPAETGPEREEKLAALNREFALLNKRTFRYRLAWVFAFVSLLPIVGLMILHASEATPN